MIETELKMETGGDAAAVVGCLREHHAHWRGKSHSPPD
jgi:hypothetical protein